MGVQSQLFGASVYSLRCWGRRCIVSVVGGVGVQSQLFGGVGEQSQLLGASVYSLSCWGVGVQAQTNHLLLNIFIFIASNWYDVTLQIPTFKNK